MEGNPGNFQSSGQPAFGQQRVVGKDDPHFIHRKAMFSKFPDEWKKIICKESDAKKRLAIFENYCNKMKVTEERNVERPNGNGGNQYQQPQQRSAMSQPLSQGGVPRMNMPHGYPAQDLPRQQISAYPAQSNSLNGQPRMMRQVAMNGELKRTHSPIPMDRVPLIKRERLDEPGGNFQQDEQMRNQRSPGGTVYVRQRTADGQIVVVPTTFVEAPINTKPVFVQTAQGIQQLQLRPVQHVVSFRNENGLRNINTNFTHSPQASPASSSSSNEMDIRTVPDEQQLRRRMITPRGVIEEPIEKPRMIQPNLKYNQVKIKEEPLETPRMTQSDLSRHHNVQCSRTLVIKEEPIDHIDPPTRMIQPDLRPQMYPQIRRNEEMIETPRMKQPDLKPNALMYQQAIQQRSAPSPPENGQLKHPDHSEMPTLSRQDVDPPRSQPPMNKTGQQNVIDEIRRDPEYKKMITSLREKYEIDLKRISQRAIIDGKQPSKAIYQILQVLNYKAALPKDKWTSFELFVKSAIESSSLCFPLLQELRRINRASPENQPIEKKPTCAESIFDPWYQCKDRIVQMPQFIVEYMNSEDSSDF